MVSEEGESYSSSLPRQGKRGLICGNGNFKREGGGEERVDFGIEIRR